jgi:hypothetical protein
MYFFSELDRQTTDWEEEHRETTMGKYGGFWGTAFSMQADLMNPFGVVDYAQNPNRLNFLKMAYNPSIAFGGYWLAAKIAGEQMPSLAVRMVNSGYNTMQIAQHTARSAGVTIARYSPYAMFAAGLAALGYYGSQLYGALSGTAGIGDMRIKYQ